MYLYIDGRVVSKEEAVISPFDHGFMYGLGAFETFRTYNGHPFLLAEHVRRLNEALEELNISLCLNMKRVREMVAVLLSKNEWDDAYFRLNVSAGMGDIGLQTEPYRSPVVILFAKPLPQPGAMPAEKELVILKTVRNTPEGEKRLKSHHYLNSILGKRELRDGFSQEGVFLTKEGFVSEGTVSNLFWVRDGVLYTPGLSTGILNGITRQWVIAAANVLNIPLKTGNYNVDELIRADEIFLTNSIQELVPVGQLQDRMYRGQGGEIVQSLQKLYNLQKFKKRNQIGFTEKG
jgi:4-amino-4-deoxychorismate lyase